MVEDNKSLVIVCAIVGVLSPIIGAILYYVLKNKNLEAAQTANKCAWISFIVQVILIIIFK